jgi:hypothetical protein
VAQIEGAIVIRRPIEEVFDFVADERNEPRCNHAVQAARACAWSGGSKHRSL